MNVHNKEILLEKIESLIKKSTYSSLEVYTKGNKLYLLKDINSKIYVLFIPNHPLDSLKKRKIIELGFKEIWENINYEKSISYINKDVILNLCNEIEFILNNILNIDYNRTWRYEFATGMAVLKDNSTPLSTQSVLMVKNKKKLKIKRIFFNNYMYALLLGLFILMSLFNKGLIEKISLFSILITFFISFILVYAISFIGNYDINAFRDKGFFNKKNEAFFKEKGFKRIGNRYRGELKGYAVELLNTARHSRLIIVYHQEISWNRVLSLEKSNYNSSNGYNWIKMHYSQKAFKYRKSNEKLVLEAEKFVELLISLNIKQLPPTHG